MDIIISNQADKPIYDQIVTQIKEMVFNGKLKSGDAIPSMRQMAKMLRVSVITVQRAYEELQKDGFIISEIGKGSSITAFHAEAIKEERLKRMEKLLGEAISIGKEIGITEKRMQKLVALFYAQI